MSEFRAMLPIENRARSRLLSEMIDTNSHILPGLDDGAQGMEDALEMLRLAAEHGTTEIVATPHADPRYRFEPAKVEQSLAGLREAAGGGPRIHYGCELH